MPKVTFNTPIPITKGLDEFEGNRPLFELVVPFTFTVDGEHTFTVPAGFVFDYASVPRGLWNTFPPYCPLHAAASLIHDWCYAGQLFPRLYADDLFDSAMEFRGVKRIRRRLMTFAVKVGGWVTWNQRTLDGVMKVRKLSGITDTKIPLWESADSVAQVEQNPNYAPKGVPKRTETNRVIFHHSASDFGDAEAIDRWHRERNFSCIGYHYVITKEGHFEHGRKLQLIGAHARGRNGDSVGVCIIGHLGKKEMTNSQEQQCLKVYHDLCRAYSKELAVEFHHEECPGKFLDRDAFTKMLKAVI